MRSTAKTMIWLTLFSIAMGYLETAVVVYLRKIYYPDGFAFPLVPISPDIAAAEFWREAATIVMLAGIGVLSARTRIQGFIFFLYSFAIWDIFYYIFLKLLLNWPESLLTWDILFLIPVPWVGPVIAPCIVSLSMITLCLIILDAEKRHKVRLLLTEWILLISGSIVVMISFMWDYIMFQGRRADTEVWTPGADAELFNEIATYVPSEFNWPLYLLGQLIIFIACFLIYKRFRK
jgi:hypothetical protein